MKKLITMLVSALMVVSMLSISVFADETPMFTVEKVTAKPDSTVSVPIKLSNNTGIWGFAINVRFDTKVFSFEQIKNNADVFNNGEFTIGPSDFTKGYVRICAYSNKLNANNKKNGTLCTLVFNVNKDASPGEYPLEVEYDDNSACDYKTNYVKISATDGSIRVSNDTDNVAKTEKSDKAGEVIAKAKNGKLVSDPTTVSNQEAKTEIVTQYKTDKNGNYVTNAKGEKETVTEYVTVKDEQAKTDENGETIKQDTGNSDNPSVSDNKNAEKNKENLSLTTTVLIILGAVVAAGILVAIIVIVVKKKH